MATIQSIRPNPYLHVFFVIATMCMLIITTAVTMAARAYITDLESKAKPLEAVVASKPEVVQCTKEQAVIWWTGQKDYVAARNQICGIKGKHK